MVRVYFDPWYEVFVVECAQEVYFINLIEWDVIEVCYFKFIILFVHL